jgi:hypothetical protein
VTADTVIQAHPVEYDGDSKSFENTGLCSCCWSSEKIMVQILQSTSPVNWGC